MNRLAEAWATFSGNTLKHVDPASKHYSDMKLAFCLGANYAVVELSEAMRLSMGDIDRARRFEKLQAEVDLVLELEVKKRMRQ